MSTGGPDYDGRKCAEARQLIYSRHGELPGVGRREERRSWNARWPASTCQQAEKDFMIAEFYRRTGHPGLGLLLLRDRPPPLPGHAVLRPGHAAEGRAAGQDGKAQAVRGARADPRLPPPRRPDAPAAGSAVGACRRRPTRAARDCRMRRSAPAPARPDKVEPRDAAGQSTRRLGVHISADFRAKALLRQALTFVGRVGNVPQTAARNVALLRLRSPPGPCPWRASALLLLACAWDGHFTILGLHHAAAIMTRASIPSACPFSRTAPIGRGLEFDLTQAVVREIEAKTPYKVISDPCTRRHRVDRDDYQPEQDADQSQPAERRCARARNGLAVEMYLAGPAPVTPAKSCPDRGGQTAAPAPARRPLPVPQGPPQARDRPVISRLYPRDRRIDDTG